MSFAALSRKVIKCLSDIIIKVFVWLKLHHANVPFFTLQETSGDRISCFDTLTTSTVDLMNAVKAPFPEVNRDPDLAFKLAAQPGK